MQQQKKGKLIVIEGTDGSGKATQVDIVRKKLERKGILLDTFSFPRYYSEWGEEIKRYLDGYFGDPTQLDPKLSSPFYAKDRAKVRRPIIDSLNSGRLVLCDRYTGSNLAHQGAKLAPEKRPDFFKWVENYEYKDLRIPKPDLTICLNIPTEEITKAMQNRKKDGHEANKEYQKKVVETYLELSERDDWRLINCMKSKKRKSIEEVAEEILKEIIPLIK